MILILEIAGGILLALGVLYVIREIIGYFEWAAMQRFHRRMYAREGEQRYRELVRQGALKKANLMDRLMSNPWVAFLLIFTVVGGLAALGVLSS